MCQVPRSDGQAGGKANWMFALRSGGPAWVLFLERRARVIWLSWAGCRLQAVRPIMVNYSCSQGAYTLVGKGRKAVTEK